jgi:hypothetical protein
VADGLCIVSFSDVYLHGLLHVKPFSAQKTEPEHFDCQFQHVKLLITVTPTKPASRRPPPVRHGRRLQGNAAQGSRYTLQGYCHGVHLPSATL